MLYFHCMPDLVHQAMYTAVAVDKYHVITLLSTLALIFYVITAFHGH